MKRIAGMSSALTFLLCLVQFHNPAAQEKQAGHSPETAAKVPVLTDFHKVIYKLWHTAWPDRNIPMLVGLVSDIGYYADTLGKTALPGILRDRQGAWRENVARLQEIVVEYRNAASPVDSQGLLDAAERLHAQYEQLVRIIRPVLKEIDEFHQVLYMIYHHYAPNKDRENLLSSQTRLRETMAALSNATLPERLKKKELAFREACSELSSSVDAYLAAVQKGDDTFGPRLESMHARYQALERVFE